MQLKCFILKVLAFADLLLSRPASQIHGLRGTPHKWLCLHPRSLIRPPSLSPLLELGSGQKLVCSLASVCARQKDLCIPPYDRFQLNNASWLTNLAGSDAERTAVKDGHALYKYSLPWLEWSVIGVGSAATYLPPLPVCHLNNYF